MAESSLGQSPFGVDDELPEVDQLFSQIPLLQDLEEAPEEASTPVPTARFGPLVTASQITAVQKAGVPENTKKLGLPTYKGGFVE